MENKRNFVLALMALGSIAACEKSETPENIDPPFSWSDYYIAGTLNPAGNSRYSPFLINIENDSIANFISTTRVFPGKYLVENDTLTFRTDDKEKWVTLAIEEQEITNSHYEVRFYKEDGSYDPAPVQYETSAELALVPGENQLAGKIYKGNQYKFGTEGVFQEGFTYIFGSANQTYGSGNADPDENSFEYELFSNVAFRYENGSTRELGVLISGKLVAFKESGLFYWGTFDPQ